MSQALEAGDLVEALPGNELEGLYSAGDRGTVQSVYAKENGERRIAIVWAGSGATSSMREDIWQLSVNFVQKQKLELGDLVRSLPGKDMICGNLEYYKAGDEGAVQSFNNPDGSGEHVNVAWVRTGQTSSIPTESWMTCCELIKKQKESLTNGTIARVQGLQGAKHLNGSLVTCERWDAQKQRWTVRLENGEEKALKPENLLCGKGVETLRPGESPKIQEELCVGDLVRATDGNRLVGFYEACDEGTVQEVYIDEDGEQRFRIVWAQSGKAASVRRKDVLGALYFVRKQTLESGDTVQALPGMELTREGKEYYKAGDEATVIETISAGQDSELVRVLWDKSSAVSDLPKAQWMSFVRIVRKGNGGAKPLQSATARSQLSQKPMPQQGTFKVGQRARVQGLQSAAHRNGQVVECKSWDEGKSRWLVHVVTDECLLKPIEMSIKPENLFPI
mmetsp:Transcript_67071/g.106155  ORF Transcript_67071/g.106155 Transcript_67071/m.106155 type:complete len:449 (-) Transcript_67071:155-1501(-)